MAVLIEGISVVVRWDAIDRAFRGGRSAFLTTLPNKTYCGATTSRASGSWPRRTYRPRRLSRVTGSSSSRNGELWTSPWSTRCAARRSRAGWLEFGRVVYGESGGEVGACWLRKGPRRAEGARVSTAPMTIATPAGWRYEGSLSARHVFVPTGETRPAGWSSSNTGRAAWTSTATGPRRSGLHRARCRRRARGAGRRSRGGAGDGGGARIPARPSAGPMRPAPARRGRCRSGGARGDGDVRWAPDRRRSGPHAPKRPPALLRAPRRRTWRSAARRPPAAVCRPLLAPGTALHRSERVRRNASRPAQAAGRTRGHMGYVLLTIILVVVIVLVVLVAMGIRIVRPTHRAWSSASGSTTTTATRASTGSCR